MNILKRWIKKFDDFIGRNSAYDPYGDELFRRDMCDYYSDKVIPLNEKADLGNLVPGNSMRVGDELTAPITSSKRCGVSMTAGHLACQGGLRGHSVGDVFPYVPYFKGKDGEQVWVHCPGGTKLGPFATQEQMYDALEFLGVYREQKGNKGV